MHRLVIVTLSALVPCGLCAETAEALSCAPDPVVVFPATDATGVPQNTVVVALAGGPAITLTAVGGEPVALAEDTSVEVPEGYIFLRPVATLLPNQRYRLSFDQSGFETGVDFMTGTALDETAPQSLDLVSFDAAVTILEADSCLPPYGIGTGSRIAFDYVDETGDLALVFTEITNGSQPDATRLLHENSLGNGLCSDVHAAPALDPSRPVCITLRGFDAAGNAVVSDEVCQEASQCSVPTDCSRITSCGEFGEFTPPADGNGCATGSGGGVLAVLWLALSRRRRRSPSAL
jgi:hypothetical protein